ncbi:hypothetical protein BFJ66_g7083 [Fusarium oxysporum f. sp. cepae]|nr:hypothetical protein BFJ65_g4307 [Fusarium oxysporum f. sp. cepae]RKK44910.1 hypothetical protein BFJ67_g8973 [Fusarium oxysporum f. sp. cepae]RKK49439.1 hypothetical protein BFJ66_g7083 [Fusarium oxysporum f. sp. cepae]
MLEYLFSALVAIVAVVVAIDVQTKGHPLTNGLLEVCGELGILVLAYSPLGQGFLGGKIKPVEDLQENDMRAKIHPRWQGDNFRKNAQLVDDIEALAKKKGCTVSQIAINWLLSLSRRPGMSTIVPIPGSTKPDRIRENATIIDLTDEDLRDIDRLLASFTPAGDRYPPQHMKYVSA